MLPRWHLSVAAVATIVAVLSVGQIERAQSSVKIEHTWFGETPVTLYRGEVLSKATLYYIP